MSAGFECSGKPGVCNTSTVLCEVSAAPGEGLCMYRNVANAANYRDDLHELGGRDLQVRLVILDARVYSIALE